MTKPNPTWAQICARRLQRHGLVTPFDDIETAVRAMCSTHAQVMSAAEVSISLRTRSTTKHDVARALWQDQTLIKTYGLRGTVHLVPAVDLPMWTGALDAIVESPKIPNGLTMAQTDEVIEAIATALGHDGKTIQELDDAVIDICGLWAAEAVMPNFGGAAPRWRQALGIAARRGVLCFGPNRGRNITYARAPKHQPRRDGLNWLVTQYLHAYGPATPAQFARWVAGSKVKAVAAFNEADLEETETGWINRGDAEWSDPEDTARPDPHKERAHLLPYFDAYPIGSHPRELVFGEAANRAAPRGSAGNFPVLLIDGVVAGIWHQRKSGARLDLTIEPFVDLRPETERAIRDQVLRLEEIHGARATMTFGPVTVTSHR